MASHQRALTGYSHARQVEVVATLEEGATKNQAQRERKANVGETTSKQK